MSWHNGSAACHSCHSLIAKVVGLLPLRTCLKLLNSLSRIIESVCTLSLSVDGRKKYQLQRSYHASHTSYCGNINIIWLTAHRMKWKLARFGAQLYVSDLFSFCSDQWIHNSKQTVRPRAQNVVVILVLSTSKFNCNSSDNVCYSCKVTWELD